MAYPNYYQGYQPNYGYMPPMQDQLAQLRQNQYQPPQQANNGINWVQGEEGAKGYLVAAGSSVLLMDSENSAFYIKSTDASGMPLPLRIFDYTERTAQKAAFAPAETPGVEYVTRQEFDALSDKINGILSAFTTDKKSSRKKEDPADE